MYALSCSASLRPRANSARASAIFARPASNLFAVTKSFASRSACAPCSRTRKTSAASMSVSNFRSSGSLPIRAFLSTRRARCTHMRASPKRSSSKCRLAATMLRSASFSNPSLSISSGCNLVCTVGTFFKSPGRPAACLLCSSQSFTLAGAPLDVLPLGESLLGARGKLLSVGAMPDTTARRLTDSELDVRLKPPLSCARIFKWFARSNC
mmetsp:Transcript_5793/g.9280  ORF Transcript_5793/g.9280 Transcript_5793/m.9280 type:complete len:210 (+) Transcript_5793:223-852(+)